METLLEQLYARIETAWRQQRDDQLVDHLAEQYPQFKDELDDFFALLIDDELAESLPPEAAAESIEQTKRWLQSEGFEQAVGRADHQSGSTTNRSGTITEASSTNETPAVADACSTDLMSLLTEHTGRTEEEIGIDNDIPDEVMIFIEDRFEETPVLVREEAISRFARNYGMDTNKLRRAASSGSQMELKAAYKDSSYQRLSFAETIRQSMLNKQVKEYWLDLAERKISDEEI